MATRRVVFNNGRVGDIAQPAVTRATTAYDAVSGTAKAANEARFGPPVMRSSWGEWTELRAKGTSNYNVASGGVDRDGTTRLFVEYPSSWGQVMIWKGADPSGTAPNTPNATYEINMNRTGHGVDLLNGSPIEEYNNVYRPVGVLVLPGCILFNCTRYLDQLLSSTSSGGVDLDADGVALIAYQHEANDSWTLTKVGATPTSLGVNNDRGAAWSMSAFPVTLGQSPLTDVFITLVDYRFGAKNGGEAFICRATRADADSNWSFGTFYRFYNEESKTNTHFHTAAWTPNGVVLSKGESYSKNECILFTCDDWDDYGTAGNWTTYVRAYGADDSHGSGEDETHSAQFINSWPHPSDLNKILCASDVMSGSLLQMTVPSTPTDGLTFKNIGTGQFSLPDNSNGIKGWSNFGGTTRVNDTSFFAAPQYADISNKKESLRLTGSFDGETAGVFARYPTHVQFGASPAIGISGDNVLTSGPNTGVTGYTNSIPIPSMKGPYNPLAVSPGATNLLITDSGALYSVAAGAGGTVTLNASAGHPGVGPAYDVVGTDTNATLITCNLTDGTTIARGNTWVVGWIKQTSAKGLNATSTLTDGGAGTDACANSWTTRDQWEPFQLYYDTSGYAADFVPTFTLSSATAAREADFTIAIEGIYVGSEVPYQMAEDTVGADEQVEIRLPRSPGNERTIAVTLHVPYHGLDWVWEAHATHGDLPLATIWGDANDYIEFIADLTNETCKVNIVVSGVSTTKTLSEFVVQRGDNILLAATIDDAAPLTTVYAICGGVTENGVQSDTLADVIDAEPYSVRIGDNDMSNVSAIDVVAIDMDTAVELSEANMLALAAPASPPSLTLTPPTIEQVYVGTHATSTATYVCSNVTVQEGDALLAVWHGREQDGQADGVVSTLKWDAAGANEDFTVAAQQEIDFDDVSQNTIVGAGYLVSPTAKSGTVTLVFTGALIRGLVNVFRIRGLDTTNPIDLASLFQTIQAGTTVNTVAAPVLVNPGSLVVLAGTGNNQSVPTQACDVGSYDGTIIYDETIDSDYVSLVYASQHSSTNGGLANMGMDFDELDRAAVVVVSLQGIAGTASARGPTGASQSPYTWRRKP